MMVSLLRAGQRLLSSVKSLLSPMIESDATPTMKQTVAAAGTSARTFQRQLEVEGGAQNCGRMGRRCETLRQLHERNVKISAVSTGS